MISASWYPIMTWTARKGMFLNKQSLMFRVGSIAADDMISFTVSNYDVDSGERDGDRDNNWINR
jgi:hypothetical protein